jgi:GT2 family glycosyltransferase
MTKISASIVIYNENKTTLKRAIKSFLNIYLEKELIIFDNSKTNILQEFCEDFKNTKYIHSGQNVGFGAGHNRAFKELSIKSDIHIIINPDVYFNDDSMKNFILWMNENKDISLSVPLVKFPNNKPQYTIRNIPTISTLFKRRLNIFGIFDKFIAQDEFANIEFKKPTEIPFAHGCFLMFQASIFRDILGFDERFFMYMEDIDIFIRAKKYGKTIVYPYCTIYHEYKKGSLKNIRLLYYHIISAIKFFIK